MKKLAAVLFSCVLWSAAAAEPDIYQPESTQEFESSEQIDFWDDTFVCNYFPYTPVCAWMPTVHDLYAELRYGCTNFNEEDLCKEIDTNYDGLGECSWGYYNYVFFSGAMHTLFCHRCSSIQLSDYYWTVRVDPAVCQLLY